MNSIERLIQRTDGINRIKSAMYVFWLPLTAAASAPLILVGIAEIKQSILAIGLALTSGLAAIVLGYFIFTERLGAATTVLDGNNLAGNSTSATRVATVIRQCRGAFWGAAVFSGIVNILVISGPLYALYILDRILVSREVPKLLTLSIFLVGAYVLQYLLDILRSRIFVHAASFIISNLTGNIYNAVLHLNIRVPASSLGFQPVHDLDQIGTFLTSAGAMSLFDLPWSPIFIAICFLIHPWLGSLALLGAVIQIAVAILVEDLIVKSEHRAAREAEIRTVLEDVARHNSDTVISMGMSKPLTKQWTNISGHYYSIIYNAANVTYAFGGLSKFLRVLLQALIIGLGAYLVIQEQITAGAMIAASILVGVALAPAETAIANWRAFASVRRSIRRLSELLETTRKQDGSGFVLPKPRETLDVEQITIVAPGIEKPILTGVNFNLAAGEALGIIGPSGAGKTSLARTIVGIWRPLSGAIRLDGAALEMWDNEFLGRHIGFVGQDIELFQGTVAENIARMDSKPDVETVLKAARVAGAHEMILRLPFGYDTNIGIGGITLAAGQKQRIAIARAFFGEPFLIVLDEPHSVLDNEGEVALTRAIHAAKARSSIVVIIAHRPSALAECDKVLFLAHGTQQAFGSRDEVLKKILVNRPDSSREDARTHLKIVFDRSINER